MEINRFANEYISKQTRIYHFLFFKQTSVCSQLLRAINAQLQPTQAAAVVTPADESEATTSFFPDDSIVGES